MSNRMITFDNPKTEFVHGHLADQLSLASNQDDEPVIELVVSGESVLFVMETPFARQLADKIVRLCDELETKNGPKAG